MAHRTAGVLALALAAWSVTIHAQQRQPVHPDLQGIWVGGTLTPLQRPLEAKDKARFTPEEAAEYERTAVDRSRSRLPTEADRITQTDLDETYVERELIRVDRLRTSLIVDPPNGMLPPLVPGVQARVAARPGRTAEGPENFNLSERCLLGMFPIGGSTASPPLVPNPNVAPYYQIVQTRDTVLIVAEWAHDARIVRINGTHVEPAIRKWLGDSIGHWEGNTLVVDTTNFRSDTHNLDSTDRLHVVERFTKIDARTLMYRVTVEDPDTWTAPWTAEWPFTATDAVMYEVACHEGNLAIENALRGARFAEKNPSPAK